MRDETVRLCARQPPCEQRIQVERREHVDRLLIAPRPENPRLLIPEMADEPLREFVRFGVSPSCVGALA